MADRPPHLVWFRSTTGETVLKVTLSLQEFFLGCEAGFDGGHTPRYHVEVYEIAAAAEGEAHRHRRRRFHLAHNITRSVPAFHVHQLKPLTAYAVVAYASNSLGRKVGDLSLPAPLPAQCPGCCCVTAASSLVFSTVLPD